MKRSIFFIILTTLLSLSIFAQNSYGPNIWLGNTFGPSTDWHNSSNWSKGRVPSEFDDVIIPDLSNKGVANYPVISYEATVKSLLIHQRANLSIKQEGSLTIEETAISQNINASNIQNQGLIMLGLPAPDLRKNYDTMAMGTVLFYY